MNRPPAKINLGLNIIRKRTDGFHDLETVFLPVPLYDELSLEDQTEKYEFPCRMTITGNAIECDEQKNLVVKAYNILANDFSLPPVHVYLYKNIPSQAGMGGGSSDAAYMLKALNTKFELSLTDEELESYASKLGSDCAFFIKSQPAYAEGIGDKLYRIPGISYQMRGLKLAIVKPPISISTREAYTNVTPHSPIKNCVEVVMQPIETWNGILVNDFEETLFHIYPELAEIKRTLYRMGALYASMSGSGSALYGFFDVDKPLTKRQLRRIFPECFTALVNLDEERNGQQE